MMSQKRYKYKKQIAPRLFSGESRDNYSGGLPPAIREGLRKIAFDEKKSVSWVLEEVIIRYFGLRKPKYVERKVKKNKSKTNRQM